ncbi:MAG: hypothetical protein AAFV90_20965 [Cyanobacteria bacterium J06634_5]
MTSFDLHTVLSSSSSEAIGMQDLTGLLKVHVRRRLDSRLASLRALWFTELDQAFAAWGVVTILIFSQAQFTALSWTTQAAIDTALTAIVTGGTSGLTWKIASTARLRWVVGLWAMLMMVGMALTLCGIHGGVAVILMNLCPLWLGICALGYGVMAVGMRSRCFATCALVHGLAIPGLSIEPSWQFFTSGLVMSLTLFFFSIVPWDMQSEEDGDPC